MTVDPDDHWQRALLLFEQHRLDMAIAEIHRVLAQDPEHFGAHALFAQSLTAKGHHPEAVKQARRLVGLHPDEAMSHAILADALLANGKHEPAIEAIRAAIAIDPNEPDFHATLARAHLLRERWQSALVSALRGLELDPEHRDCRDIRARALAYEGEHAEARAAAAEELARHPDDGDAHALAGSVELLARDHDAALQRFLEALRIDPSLRHARHGLLEALRARNPWFRAMAGVARKMDKGSRPIGMLVTLSWIVPRHAPRNPDVIHVFAVIQSLLALGFLCLLSARPIANASLLLSRYGRHGLRRGVAIASVAISCVAIAGVGLWVFARMDGADGFGLGWPFWIALVVTLVGALGIAKAEDG